MIKQGVKVSYPSGREMSIESATMMTVRTGISQCAGAIALKRMEELEWDTILVSAHVGARIGDGGNNPTNHFWWQGKFYSRTGKDKRFPDFRTSTGYGTVTGLCGVNCRHSFGSGDGENNPYADINLSSEDNIKAEERAKKQRLMERRIRNSKREIQNLQTAIDASGDDKLKFELQKMYDRKSAVLRRQNKQYRDYCKENDLKEYSERLRVAQWDRSQAVRSAKAAQRYSQANRWGNPDYDCSSLVISAWQQAGVPVKSNGATYTGNMYNVFRACGFTDVTASCNRATGAGMQRGDVLLNVKYHTAMYIGGGQMVQASSTRGHPQAGDQTGTEIWVCRYYNYSRGWDYVLRYTKGGSAGGGGTPTQPSGVSLVRWIPG